MFIVRRSHDEPLKCHTRSKCELRTIILADSWIIRKKLRSHYDLKHKGASGLHLSSHLKGLRNGLGIREEKLITDG
ncbi:hypothetical protein CEXT_194471 [Caerostris extrusa]|uniref:Uncharacterized protein n=1 Tax=Caerostris extrusa TaxID=172846 RepID=A0AAV4MMB1_CAEEX|nr:hypothetical protein CEXT_194471 [Caerostris extrusa]